LIFPQWSDLCKAYLQEAKWFHNKIIPPFDKYLENARISIAAGAILTHFYFLVSQDISEQVIHSLTDHDHDLLRSVYTICRLSNDLGTSTVILTLFCITLSSNSCESKFVPNMLLWTGRDREG